MSFSQFVFPKPLRPGSHIAITGPSGGVAPKFHARLDLVLRHLRDRGFEVTEGRCLRDERKHVSAPKADRAKELMSFLIDDRFDAIFPPWGGEVLIEILPLLDFEKIRASKPKWITSYSDISTLHFALTSQTGIATAHSPNLMDLAPIEVDSNDLLTSKIFEVLALNAGEKIVQMSSEHYQPSATLDIANHPAAVFEPTTPTRWKSLKSESSVFFQGRLIGGCLDTISCLTGTPYGDLTSFKKVCGKEGYVFFLENCKGSPTSVVRMLNNLRFAGWFEGASGILIGRSSGPDATTETNLNYVEALNNALGDLNVPVIFDVDLGHQPPQMTLVNGAKAEVTYREGRGELAQTIG